MCGITETMRLSEVPLGVALATTRPMISGILQAYAALFGTAFLAATILPAQSELLFAYLIRSGEYDWRLLLATATAGNVLGSVVNWLLGRMIERFRDRRWFPVGDKALDRAERWYGRWGKWSLLLSWAPIIGDALTVIAGVLRTPFATFLSLVLIAKAGRYCLIVLAVMGTLRG
jgi:membrane protein YqaA with SNARE-associated domain